jgi:hypothetical protein
MVQSTKDRPRFDTPGALNEPSNRRILAWGEMRSGCCAKFITYYSGGN